MFARVVIGVDGADGGLDAAALAAVFADPEATVDVVHVATRDRGAGAVDPESLLLAARDALTSRLAPDAAPTLSTILVHGRSVADGLHRYAELHSADLIVVGSHHRRRTGHLWSADRTRATLRDAPCPVAVAPEGFVGAPAVPFGVIGVAFDDTTESREALLYGRALAGETGARIHVMWVVERSNWTDATSGTGWRAVEAGRRLAALHGVVGVAVEGDPGRARQALASFAGAVDLLILGSHHHALLRRLVLGDTVEGLSRHPRCPLLVLPHETPGHP